MKKSKSLSGGKSRDPGTCEREARVRQSCSPTEQARREQPPTDARGERRIPQGDFLRGVRGFRDPKRTQNSLSCFGPIRQHFALKRHLLRASLYRKQLAARFVAWCKI
jgi:hypothetical protein